mmetsp:Transcript_59416/g.158079  ORF Transcript_59416/g.158079 Transcript_59416/m.158079 type:complete len:748 (-) Transcript_59416:87-2330(-)
MRTTIFRQRDKTLQNQPNNAWEEKIFESNRSPRGQTNSAPKVFADRTRSLPPVMRQSMYGAQNSTMSHGNLVASPSPAVLDPHTLSRQVYESYDIPKELLPRWPRAPAPAYRPPTPILFDSKVSQSQQLRHQGNFMNQIHGDLVFVRDGSYHRRPGFGTDEWRVLQDRGASTYRQFLDFVQRRDNYFVIKDMFQRKDVNRTGWVTLAGLKEMLRELPLHMNDDEVDYVMQRIVVRGSYRFNYDSYLALNMPSRSAEKRWKAIHRAENEAKEEEARRLREAAGVNRLGTHKSCTKRVINWVGEHVPWSRILLGRDAGGARYVFLLGFLVCPFWCLGWGYVRSTSRTAKYLGLLSIALAATAGTVAGLLVLFLVIRPGESGNAGSATTKDVSHCPMSMGVLAELRASGPSAYERFFGNYSRAGSSPYWMQGKLKDALMGLYAADAMAHDEGRVVPQDQGSADVVLLDSIRALNNDPLGMSLSIVFKIERSSSDGVTRLLGYMTTWEQRLPEWLQNYGINFNNVSLATRTTKYYEMPWNSPTSYVQTKVGFDQMLPNRPIDNSVVLNGLYRQPPSSDNIMDVNAAGWELYSDPALHTCWYTHFVQVYATTEAPAVSRSLRVDLLSNSDMDLYHLYVRQVSSASIRTLSEAVAALPAPNWFLSSVSFDADGAQDPTRCIPFDQSVSSAVYGHEAGIGWVNANGDELACLYTYSTNLTLISTYQYNLWIGVVGKTSYAQYLPFTLRFRINTR